MKSYTLLLFFLFFGLVEIEGQECTYPTGTAILHGNAIKTTIRNGGHLFINNDNKGHFQVPYTGNDSPSTIFSTDFIMGGIVENEIKVASNESVGFADGYDYWAGPLNAETGLIDTLICHQFNKVWTVSRYEIEVFLADLADNQQIDNPIESIMGYPAKGNPHFENINGFALPEREQNFAPFFDKNSDGLYQPEDGDYPHPTSVHPDIIPEEMTWCVFNDTKPRFLLPSLQLEVQLTTYALSCEDNPILNHTIFTNYQVFNFSNVNIDSFHVGFRTNFDLGCRTDDALGAYPEQNTFYVYNVDNIDGQIGNMCSNDIIPYTWNMPVQAATVLNHDLDYFTYTSDVSTGTGPFCTQESSSINSIYNFMSGSLRTGFPFTHGDIGCYGIEPIKFVFPDNPNDENGWSMLNTDDLSFLGTTYIGYNSTYFDSLPSQSSISLDYAWSFHYHPDSNHLQNVNLMYENIPLLQNMYEEGFVNTCQQEALCETDCIWTGDTNADGIANHQDLLPIAVGLAMSGSGREAPYNWSPQTNTDWAFNYPDGNVNYKHIDANGDGLILTEDFEMTLNHYGFTTPDYVPADIYTEGANLFLEARDEDTNLDSIHSNLLSLNIRLADLPSLYGLSFTIEYDTAYLRSARIFAGNDWSYADLQVGETHYVQSKINGVDILTDEDFPRILLQFHASFDEPLPSPSTTVRFKNIRANDRMGNHIEVGAQDLNITLVDVPVSIHEIEKNTVRLYPNPVQDKLYLEMPQNVDKYAVTNIKMWNTVGNLIFSTKLTGSKHEIEVADLPSGIYFLTIQQGAWIGTAKFVK